ncbi:MAG: glucuronate isomerase [candidate division WOR-3 bacterium]|nr:glucuronate isomerase [candidate division WOR-3 bacterium]
MGFIDEDYLITSANGKSLFAKISGLPIVDAHSHIEAEQIATNNGWRDIWEVEGATDHYVWELMRRSGVRENYITGDASNREKWLALAEVFPSFAGNPVYDWLHLDLRRRFKIDTVLGPKTGAVIWEESSSLLKDERFRPRNLLKQMGVEILCTTDSPTSELNWHKLIQEKLPGIRVLPTWRPDIATDIGSSEWKVFLRQLSERTDIEILHLPDFLEALKNTHDLFTSVGCIASDHAFEQPWGDYVSEKAAARIFERALHCRNITESDRTTFSAFMLHFFGTLDSQAGLVMQLHIGAVRNYRNQLLNTLGRDSGGDIASHNIELVNNLRNFLNEFDGHLQIVLYGLHPSHIYSLATLTRAFPNVYMGAPWWFMDNPYHMHEHLAQVASVDLLANHTGMVTDSRKLFSYESRTEMFRRVLADFLGNWVDQGRIPFSVAEGLAVKIAYYRPKQLFFSGAESND